MPLLLKEEVSSDKQMSAALQNERRRHSEEASSNIKRVVSDKANDKATGTHNSNPLATKRQEQRHKMHSELIRGNNSIVNQTAAVSLAPSVCTYKILSPEEHCKAIVT